ncbi:MAG: hypothetical protein EOP11_04905 [Proteobacteria bacterium]|nr:MAG: hypothetical protein EOP11_04905 [Pseudomonadota bacterium]
MRRQFILILLCQVFFLDQARAEGATPKASWLYFSPAYDQLSLEETNSPGTRQHFANWSLKSFGLRGGTAFGPWGVEGNVGFSSFDIDSLSPQFPGKYPYRGTRFSIEAMRRLFSSREKFGWNGYAHLGFQSYNLPIVGPEPQAPELGKVRNTGLAIGISVNSYVARNTRIVASAKWLPVFTSTHSLSSASADLKNGLNFEINLGAQYLLDSFWSVGLEGSVRRSKMSGTMRTLAGATSSFEASAGQSGLHAVLGYQF